VTIPATIIPILIAAFCAYALAWMKFPGRAILIAVIVGLLVVPLQMSLIPLLRLYNGIGAFFGVPAKTYVGIWLAHMGFGLPLAVYLCATTWPACRARSWNRPASTAPATSKSS
jgi:alpha-glucoside transport system permease protein